METIRKPSVKDEERSVGPEKGGEKESKPPGRNGEFVLQRRSGDGKRASVDVGDEERQEEKGEDGPEGGREFLGLRSVSGVHGAGIVYQERGERKKKAAGLRGATETSPFP